ncbi:MAG: (d)CMP kinase [Clostridia bacterium]|nr:(d)CMP kinase [Clostridia bacterium]
MINIAIDGPSGAGKSSLAKALAKKLDYIYVDTGALYRAVGLFVRSKEVEPTNMAEVEKLLPLISLELDYENGVQTVYLNGENVNEKIRTPEMSMYASAVSAHPPVRTFLLDLQKNIAKKHNVIMDGRDIGTVILPDAQVKIYLFADNESRAKRRYEELLQKGEKVTLESVLEEMNLRDHNDSTRKTAPAVQAPDAIPLNNSQLDFEGTVDAALEIIGKVLGK